MRCPPVVLPSASSRSRAPVLVAARSAADAPAPAARASRPAGPACAGRRRSSRPRPSGSRPAASAGDRPPSRSRGRRPPCTPPAGRDRGGCRAATDFVGERLQRALALPHRLLGLAIAEQHHPAVRARTARRRGHAPARRVRQAGVGEHLRASGACTSSRSRPSSSSSARQMITSSIGRRSAGLLALLRCGRSPVPLHSRCWSASTAAGLTCPGPAQPRCQRRPQRRLVPSVPWLSTRSTRPGPGRRGPARSVAT